MKNRVVMFFNPLARKPFKYRKPEEHILTWKFRYWRWRNTIGVACAVQWRNKKSKNRKTAKNSGILL